MSSRAQERSAGRSRNVRTETFNLVASYTVGGDIYTSSIFRDIDRVTELGWSRQVLRGLVVTGSVTGNRFRVQFFRATGVDSVGRFTGEVASATDLSTDAFTVLIEGV